MAFEEVEPFGARQEEVRTGLLASVCWNAWFQDKKTPEDFFPSLRPPVEPQTAEDQIRMFQNVTIALGGEVKTWQP